MNRTIKDATVKRYFYDTHNQLKAHLTDFLRAYNFARRLKTLKGLTPYEYLCKLWTQTPDRFTLNPIHQMPGLNIEALHCICVTGAPAWVARARQTPTYCDTVCDEVREEAAVGA